MGFSLGSFAGGMASGITAEQQQAMQLAAQRQQQAGQTALGNALGGTPAQPPQNILSQLLGGGQPPSPPMQPSGGQPPQGGPMGGGAMPMPGGGAPPAPQGAMPQPPQAGPQQPQQPQPPQAPQAPQQGGQPQGGGVGPQLSLDQVIQRIKQFNPNIGPRELMSAIGQALPIMNAQSQQQYKQVLMQLKPAELDERKRHDQTTEDETKRRDDENAGYKRDALKLRGDEFNERQKATAERFDATLKEKYDALEATKDRSQAVQLATDVRSAIKERFSATKTEIAAANSFDPDQKKALMAKAAADRDAATARLDAALAAQKANADGQTKPTMPNADGSKRATAAPASTRAPTETAPAQDTTQLLQQAKEAIAQGAPREAVLAKLKEMGVAAPGL